MNTLRDEIKRLKARVDRLEKENEITIIRMGQMQEAFDAIFSAWQEAIKNRNPDKRIELLYEGWKKASSKMPKLK